MFHQSFQPNEHGRDFVIGDLHGMYELLFKSLEQVGFDYSRDRCFSCGDLIDRGPDSEKCISLIHEPWFFPVRGNHEQTLIQVARYPRASVLADWVLNGGRWHLMVSSKKMNQYADELDQLPHLLEVHREDGKRVAICHAEFPGSQWQPEAIAGNPELILQMLWSRQKIQTVNESLVAGIDYIICGHTIVEQPVVLGNTWFIDTGAFASKHLTVLPLDQLP